MTPETPHRGIAGALAGAFIRSKLTVLLSLAALLLGGFAALKLPREEEPQIKVPMFDLFVPYPGASAKEVEERVINVGERRLWEIPGVEYIYSTAQPNQAMFIVRFKVGTPPEEAMTRLFTKAMSNMEQLAPGALPPMIKPRSIDDVPVLALTLSGDGLSPLALRQAAATLRQELSTVPNVSESDLIGGRRRQFLVHWDPAKLAALRIAPLDLVSILQAANKRLPAGHTSAGAQTVQVETDALLHSAAELGRVIVGISGGTPVSLSQVATVTDAPDEEEREVLTLERQNASQPFTATPAVTISVSKRRGANATVVVHEALRRVEAARSLLPPSLKIAITRNYGETAKEKSDELLFHVLLATLSVTLLIALALGLREALVVLLAVPVTLALTLMIYFLFGYTLNRITLFALIFSIGILVDDAIVVVENIHRHFMMKDGRSLWQLSVDAVAEVGNPTILATWTVIAAILPMAFVGGLMGPYMRPIPVGASFAMLFSLAIAFIVSPWAFTRILAVWPPRAHQHKEENGLDRLYRRVMRRLLEDGKARALYFLSMLVLLAGAVLLVPLKAVTVKMLPFDNKDDFEIVINMPESASIDATKQATLEMANALAPIAEIRRVTTYAGTAAPYNFNGLVRHYFLRQEPYQAGIVVSLQNRHDRRRQSHAIAKEARERIARVVARYGARVQVAEVPPGPPVLSTLVFEVYGPDAQTRRQLAARVRTLLSGTDGIVDVDTYEPDAQPMSRLMVNRELATLNGIPPAHVAQTVALALQGQTVDAAHAETEKEPVEIRLRLPERQRQSLDAVRSIRLLSRNGTPMALRDLTSVVQAEQDRPIYHKNLQPVTYVIADVAGRQESPVYSLLKLRPQIAQLGSSLGIDLHQYFARQPENPLEYAVKWDGEWQVTYEVFRDLGIAFALVLLLIYILVVAWFQSFVTPLVIMAPIPLTLVGILPAHALMGAFFTATSMIGFIAGGGIVVRNSIILVDFIQLRLKEGMALKEAVIDAGAVRFRPMLLTAAAVVAGAGVILFDPIFQGLAVALMAGEVASTFLSRLAVPILYYIVASRQQRP